MNAASRKPAPTSTAGRLSRWLPFAEGSWRRVVLSLAFVGAMLGAVGYAWHRWGREITSGPQFQLTADKIDVTPPPAWVRSDVKAEVVQDGSLEGMSLLDHQLTVKVAQAFSMHSWVENVSRVSKIGQRHPARVQVELTYRKPVAMVEVTMNGQPGLLPVDVEGVLLPPQDFSADQVRLYPRISVENTSPTGPVGTPWGDGRIQDAAALATLVQESWKAIGLFRIQISATEKPDVPGEYVFELQARQGARVIWGHAPRLRDPADKRLAAAKLEKLQGLIQKQGTLEDQPSSTVVDLRERPGEALETAIAPGRNAL
jgi:hypothetical protein